MVIGEDDWTRSRWLTHARWEADLSDGTLAIGDDDRLPNSWGRLKLYCEARSLTVRTVRLRFRTNTVEALPRNAAGYLVRPGVWSDMHEQVTRGTFAVGYLDPAVNKVKVSIFFVPELVLFRQEERDVGDEQGVGESLLTNPV